MRPWQLLNTFAKQAYVVFFLQKILDYVNVLLLLGNLKGGETVLVFEHEIGSGGDELFHNRKMTEKRCGVEWSFTILE